MKKGIIISVIAIIAVIVLFIFSSQYKSSQQGQGTITALTTKPTESTSATTEPTTTEELSGVIVENKEGDYQLVVADGKITLVHGEYEKDVSNWEWSLKRELPVFYYMDFDKDGEKELLVRLLVAQYKDATNTNRLASKYYLFLFKPAVDSHGNKVLNTIWANDDIWEVPFENSITCELTQLKSNNKFLQFTMSNKGEKIVYDSKTGICNDKNVYYASASRNKQEGYYTLKSWAKDLGVYNVDEDGTMTLDIRVIVEYNEYNLVEQVGSIHCEIEIDNGVFDIKPKTIEFVPLSEHRVNDPRKNINAKWKAEIINASEAPSNVDNKINWLEYKLDVSALGDKQQQYFSEFESNIKCIDNVTFTQNKIVLTAKSGYEFSTACAENQRFKVLLYEGTDKQIDIGDMCELKEENSRSTLVIKLDSNYSKNELKDITISFG